MASLPATEKLVIHIWKGRLRPKHDLHIMAACAGQGQIPHNMKRTNSCCKNQKWQEWRRNGRGVSCAVNVWLMITRNLKISQTCKKGGKWSLWNAGLCQRSFFFLQEWSQILPRCSNLASPPGMRGIQFGKLTLPGILQKFNMSFGVHLKKRKKGWRNQSCFLMKSPLFGKCLSNYWELWKYLNNWRC